MQRIFKYKIREEEMNEMSELESRCVVKPKGGDDSVEGKINILIQTFISSDRIHSFGLNSDSMHISQSVDRIVRGLFEIVFKRGIFLN
jgi:hypothetical protein